MRLRLVSVHLVNFRIHEDYVFKPGESGITAISGRNGHGKSTIIDSISWALFGTRPARGLSASSLKRQGAPDDADTYVDVRMVLDGRDVRVKRSIHGRAAQCECWVDGVLEAGPAVSHASKWITEHLGMDESTFLSTVLVQQKQVGALVESTPANRRKVLEKLTGISAVTAALELARDEEHEYRRALDEYHVDVDRIPVIERDIASVVKNLDASSRKYESRNARLEKVRAEGVGLRADVTRLEEQASAVTRHTMQVNLLGERVKSLTERQNGILDERESLRKRLPDTIATGDSIRELERRASATDADIVSLTTQRDKLTGIINARVAAASIETMRAELDKQRDECSGIDHDGLVLGSARLESDIADQNARIRQARKSIDELSKGDGSRCPTCLQPISDVGFIQEELRNGITDANTRITEYRKQLGENSAALERYDALTRSIEQLGMDIANAEKSITDANDATDELGKVQAKLDACNAEKASINRLMMKAGQNRELQNQYDALLVEFQQVTDDLNTATRELRSEKSELKTVSKGYTEKKLSTARGKLERKRADYDALSKETLTLKGEIGVLTEKKQSMERELSDINTQAEARQRLVEHVEVSAGNVNVLSSFRNDMIANAVPQITSHASDYIRQVTEGKFTDIEIDEKCNITITTDDGKTRDVSMLSGGERDAVALCLRLAISMMLSGGEQSLMILDEPITSQDANRAELMLNTIESMNNGQVIIVAHNEIIQSIADTIIEL